MGLDGEKHWIRQSWILLCSSTKSCSLSYLWGRAQIKSDQMLEQKKMCSHIFIGVATGPYCSVVLKMMHRSLYETSKLSDVIILCSYVLQFVFEQYVYNIVTSQKCSSAQSAINICQHFKREDKLPKIAVQNISVFYAFVVYHIHYFGQK